MALHGGAPEPTLGLAFGVASVAAMDAIGYGINKHDIHSAKELRNRAITRAVVFGLIGAGITPFSTMHGAYAFTQGSEFGVQELLRQMH